MSPGAAPLPYGLAVTKTATSAPHAADFSVFADWTAMDESFGSLGTPTAEGFRTHVSNRALPCSSYVCPGSNVSHNGGPTPTSRVNRESDPPCAVASLASSASYAAPRVHSDPALNKVMLCHSLEVTLTVNLANALPRVALPLAMRKNPDPRGRQNVPVTFVSCVDEDEPSIKPKLPPPTPSAVTLSARTSNRACVDDPPTCLGNTANTSTSVHGSDESSKTARGFEALGCCESEPAPSAARAVGRAQAKNSTATATHARRPARGRDMAAGRANPPGLCGVV